MIDSRPLRGGIATTAAVIGGLLLAACGEPEPQAPPPPEVRVLTASTATLPNVIELPGRLQAVRTAEVRARVDGIVERRTYDEGTDVRAGQSLFIIDPRPLRAQLNSAEATLAREEATAANAEQDVARYEGLVELQALSEQEYDAAVARLRTAQANVALAQAQVDVARLNLSYATVTAPISGRASRAQVTEGALVSAAAATMLTSIEQTDTLFVNFSEANSQLESIRRTLADPERSAALVVRVITEGGIAHDEAGQLDFLDLSIDAATGTTALRARIPNSDRRLLPGQFVRVRMEVDASSNGMIIPQRAVTLTPEGGTVMVVGPDDVPVSRAVTLGPLRGGDWVVLEGLSDGERVITDGLQRVTPGAPVRVTAAAATDSAAAAAEGASPSTEEGPAGGPGAA